MTETDASGLLAEMEQDVADIQAAAAEDAPMTLVDMIARAHSLDNQINDLELTMKAAKKELEDLMRLRIPTELDKVGVPEIGAEVNGTRVRVALDFAAYGSLAKAPDLDAAVEYLEANGFEGGVLTTVSAQFRREARADAEALADKIRETGSDAVIEEDVNHSTLRAFVRQKVQEDPDFDAARVGVTIVRQAKFTVR
jgi:hypothetical protein